MPYDALLVSLWSHTTVDTEIRRFLSTYGIGTVFCLLLINAALALFAARQM